MNLMIWVTLRSNVFADDDSYTPIAGYVYYYDGTKYKEGKIELTSETEALLPTPHSRKNIGVSEVAITIASVAVK